MACVRYARPIRYSDGAKIGHRGSPANTVAYFEKPGLVAGHLRFTLGGSTSSIRFMSPWPVKLLWPSSHLMVTYLAPIEMTLPLSAGSPLKQMRLPTFSFLDCSGSFFSTRKFVPKKKKCYANRQRAPTPCRFWP
jgi:hypothetical protein